MVQLGLSLTFTVAELRALLANKPPDAPVVILTHGRDGCQYIEDVMTLDGDSTDPEYSQPARHPSGKYVLIGSMY